MNITKNTVLIAGGTAGIGFETAKLLVEKGNHVIITGRDQQRLDQAVAKLTNVTGIRFDITNEADVDQLVQRLSTDFSELNIVINNAGLAHVYDLLAGEQSWEKAAQEMNTNYISILRLTDKLLPQLLRQQESAVINVTSIVAIAPSAQLPTYSASKTALHAYTELLRLTLKNTAVKVFELMPPLVDTEFSSAIGGKENGIPPLQVAKDLIEGLANDTYEIHSGGTAQIYQLARTSPEAALAAMNAR